MGNLAKHTTESLPDFKEIKQRFLQQNQQRLQRAKTDMRLRQQEFVEILPLLYHINHPVLPGYINKNTVSGIPDYAPSAQALQLANRLGKSFSYKKKAYRRFQIQAIYLMGSPGTIGYSSGSDVDIWVCYDSQLTAEQIDELQQKSAQIERWAAALEVDAHIFLVDPEQFAQGQHGQLSSESSGSAQHYLLLEEFYRTGLLLAGRYPLWWLVPPEHEQDYDTYVENVKSKRFIHSRDHIDFGGLNHISAEEFYGATLWLLYKGINTPYKSVIKALLMEAYASEYPSIDLLCHRFKRYIYHGENEINKLDPYLMMLHKVEEYLQKQSDQDRLELIRRSFYFKVNEKLSEPSQHEAHWRRKLLGELVQAWNWSSSQLFILDSKANWNIPRVVRERNALIRELTHSYAFLSDFARHHTASSLIKPADLNVLGRKLYAAFERKAGKIEIIYRGITSQLYETHLSLHHLSDQEGREYWVIYSGVVSESEVNTATPLKRAHSLIELIAWCFFNKIIAAHTVTGIYGYTGELTDKELGATVAMLEKVFEDNLLQRDNLIDLRKPAYIAQMLTVINAGVDPFAAHTRRGEHLISNRTDSLRFGGRLENLALSIDTVIVTSWQEVLTRHYEGVAGMFQCLQDYMLWSPPSSDIRPSELNTCSFSSYRGETIARHIRELFESVLDCFYGNRFSTTYYVMAVEWDYYALTVQDDHLHWSKLGGVEKLHQFLGEASADHRHIVFDAATFNDNIVAQLYAHNHPGVVQCFFQLHGDRVTTHVIDERGSYFSQESEFYDAVSLVNHYRQFFVNVHQRMLYRLGANKEGPSPLPVEFYFVTKNNKGQWQLVEQRANPIFMNDNYVSLQVIADSFRSNLTLRIYCDQREFVSFDHDDRVYRDVALFILSLRGQPNKYPIYITDIDLSERLLAKKTAETQTVDYLHYKKRIETNLYDHLRRV